jgi:hypothetical protein
MSCYDYDPDGYCHVDFEDKDSEDENPEDEEENDCKDIWVTKFYPLFGVPKRPKFTLVEEHSGFFYDLKEQVANLRRGGLLKKGYASDVIQGPSLDRPAVMLKRLAKELLLLSK